MPSQNLQGCFSPSQPQLSMDQIDALSLMYKDYALCKLKWWMPYLQKDMKLVGVPLDPPGGASARASSH